MGYSATRFVVAYYRLVTMSKPTRLSPGVELTWS